MPSPVSGVLLEQAAPEGAMVRVGALLFALDAEAAGASLDSPPPTAAPPASPPVPAGAPRPSGPSALPQAAPAVRRLARELGIDLAHVQGTGPHGRITEPDVRAAA